MQLTIDAADGVLNRIDRVIVEWKTTDYADLPEIKNPQRHTGKHAGCSGTHEQHHAAAAEPRADPRCSRYDLHHRFHDY